MLAGVCAGIGQYFAIDPVLVRVAGGLLAVALILGWLALEVLDGLLSIVASGAVLGIALIAGVALYLARRT